MCGWNIFSLNVTLENVQSLDSLRELSEVSGSFERLNSYEEAGMPSRKRRQITIDGDAVPLIVSDLVVTQHCHGIYLRWKKPASPTRYAHSNRVCTSQYFVTFSKGSLL